MNIDKQIKYWAQLVNESDDDFTEDKSSVFKEDEKGDVHCSNNQLTSLEGAPQEVSRDFYCDNNQLTSLEGAPQKIGGDFYCRKNPKLSKRQIREYEEFLKHPKSEQIVDGHFHSLLGQSEDR